MHFDVSYQSLDMLRSKVATIPNRIANFVSGSSSAKRRREFNLAVLRSRLIKLKLSKKLEARFKQNLNALETNFSNLKFDRASLR